MKKLGWFLRRRNGQRARHCVPVDVQGGGAIIIVPLALELAKDG